MYIFACRVQKITVEGCAYSKGDIVVVGKEDDTPIFGQIGTIYYYCREDKCFLLSPSCMQNLTATTTHTAQSHPHTHIHNHTTTLVYVYKYFDAQLSEHMFICFKCNVL